MDPQDPNIRFLEGEARALLTRLRQLESFALRETMVLAASLPFEAQAAIERHVARLRRGLTRQVQAFLLWLRSDDARRRSADEAQRRFTMLRLRFVSVLTQFDIFSEVMTQRSEHDTGVWLSGLDTVAADALALPGGGFEPTPVVCMLSRGHGAAIRRARTRLPGGEQNPVAIIRIPRERMIGSGIASSLVHEVGHQGAAQLDLIASIRPILHGLQAGHPDQRFVWGCWERWISEIVADFWSVARLGITATSGLIGVVSLPRFFVFRFGLDDPHPPPWVRVRLSAALGNALYPDPQWAAITAIWDAFYPLAGLKEERHRMYSLIEQSIPAFVSVLIHHRPPSLRGKTLKEALGHASTRPEHLRAWYRAFRRDEKLVERTSPIYTIAALGQARADNVLTPENESRVLGKLLTAWALHSTLSRSATCVRPLAAPIPARLPERTPGRTIRYGTEKALN